MSVEVLIPANFVSAGWGTPTVCARHGESAVEQRKTQFTSRRSGWLFLMGAIVYYATRKTVTAPAWPFCAQCIGVLVGIVLFIGGAIVIGRGGRPTIAGGAVTADGHAVRFAKAHEAFAIQAAAAQQAAAQHYAAQQSYPPQPYPTQPFAVQPGAGQAAADAYPPEQPPAAV